MSFLFWATVLFASIILSLRWPIIGACIAYPMLLFGSMEYNAIPVIHTPFGVLVVFTALAALIQQKTVGRWLTSSPIFVPFVLLVIVLLIFYGIEHGDPLMSTFRVRSYLMGMWPLMLAWLILKTPNDAKALLLAALVANLILAIIVLWILTTKGQEVLAAGSPGYGVRNLAEDQGTSLSYLTMMAMALCSPVWLSLLLDGRLRLKLKLLVGVALGATAFCILLSTYSSALVSLILGTGLILATRWRRGTGNPLQYFGGIILVCLLLFGGIMLVDRLPSVQNTINRISNPQEDSSGAVRIIGILEESKAFIESPLIGHGAWNTDDMNKVTPGGHLLVGHNSITRDAASFGLLFVVPFITMLVIVGLQYRRLQKKVRAAVDAALLNGMFVSYLLSIVGGIITCTFGDLTQDTYFWTFTAIMLYWNRWADMHPGVSFFAWQS